MLQTWHTGSLGKRTVGLRPAWVHSKPLRWCVYTALDFVHAYNKHLCGSITHYPIIMENFMFLYIS